MTSHEFSFKPIREGQVRIPFPEHDFDTCVWEIEKRGPTKKLATKFADRYFETMTLTFDDRGAGFTDAKSVWRPIPASAVSVQRVRIYGETLKGGKGVSVRMAGSSLVFRDADQKLVLWLPNYGWNYKEHLAPWFDAAGLTHEEAELKLEGPDELWRSALPKFLRTPHVDAGYPYWEPRQWPWQKK